jgi:hypothetical protein
METNQEGGVDQEGGLELAKLLVAVSSRGGLREVFVSDPGEAAEQCADVDPEKMGDVLEILASYTPEQRSFLLELNETWPLRLEVRVDALARVMMPF